MGHSIRRTAADFVRADSGATAVEYSLVVALIALSLVAALQAVGISLGTMLDAAARAISAA